MRIAVANAAICASKGGSERAAIRLARELMARGHDTRLLTVRSIYGPLYELDPRIPVHFFPGNFFGADMTALAYGPSLLRANAVDILVSLESDWKHALWGKICDEAGVPHVVSERITPWLMENELWNKQARRDFLRTRAAIHELLPCYLDFVPEEDRGRTFVIPNASPEKLLHSCPLHETGVPVLLYLGRFSKEKRPGLLLDAFALLARDFPDWRLRLAGWGEKQAELEQKVKKHELEQRVEIRTAHTEVSLEYRAASLYCLPTLHEGFPNTVLEAMGNGLPVVGIRDCIAMTSIIRPGVTGELADRATPESLAAVLRPLMESADARLTMGRAAFEHVRDNYSSQLIFGKWESELEKVMRRATSSHRS